MEVISLSAKRLAIIYAVLAALFYAINTPISKILLNNIPEKSTYQIVMIKGIFSGIGSLLIAIFVGEKIPSAMYIVIAMLLGFVAYGLSIFTYIRAQRILGAAKTSAYYALAPFIGAFLAFAFVGEKLSGSFLTALALMLTGTVLVVMDTMVKSHSHLHSHTITHTHDGATHTHILEHSHSHNHFSDENKHDHKHSKKEIDKMILQVHKL